ncbi:MAG: gamma-glutamylcyclotransferase family protein [Kiloniellales bacterium]
MRFFFFGTLMDRDVLEAVIARPAPAGPFPRAVLPGYRRVKLRGESHPLILPADLAAPQALPRGLAVDGVIVEGLLPSDIDRIMFYESIDYEPRPVRVTPIEQSGAGAGPVEAHVFIGSAEAKHDDEPWDYARWLAEDKPAELQEARLWMALYGAIDYAEADRLWEEARASGRPIEDLVSEILARPQRARAGG